MPASGSLYPIAKCTSPSRIRLRNRSFCFSVPYLISVGPTVCSVTAGRCTSARWASLAKIVCSTSPSPCPPYSFGQPMPIQPSLPICLIVFWYVAPCRSTTMSRCSSWLARPVK